MSVLKSRLKQVATEKETIESQVANENTHITKSDAEIISNITATVAEKHRDEISKSGMTDDVKSRIFETITEEASKVTSDYATQKRIEKTASGNIIGLGPIEKFMVDPTITEIIVLRYDNICVERNGIVEKTDASFTDEEHLMTVINRIVQPVGRQINLSTPIVDARLSNGSRVNATIPPVTPDGATLCIRKFSESVMSGSDYLKLNSLNNEMLKFLALCVQGKVSMIVSGGTSTGKTTLLNMLSQFIPKNELIITIEDSCELRLHQPNVRRMEAKQTQSPGTMKINVQALVKNALRMRPDRIVVGEIRDGTVVDMMSAMCTGHEGSMSTVHANSPESLVNSRLPILYSMYEQANFSEVAQKMQIAEALQLIVQISRLNDGSRKITHITHVVEMTDSGNLKLEDIFFYDETEKKFKATGYIPRYILKHCQARGVNIPKSIFNKEGGNTQ